MLDLTFDCYFVGERGGGGGGVEYRSQDTPQANDTVTTSNLEKKKNADGMFNPASRRGPETLLDFS